MLTTLLLQQSCVGVPTDKTLSSSLAAYWKERERSLKKRLFFGKRITTNHPSFPIALPIGLCSNFTVMLEKYPFYDVHYTIHTTITFKSPIVAVPSCHGLVRKKHKAIFTRFHLIHCIASINAL